MAIKGQRAEDKAGDTGKGQSSLAVQARVMGHCCIRWARGTIQGLKAGVTYFTLACTLKPAPWLCGGQGMGGGQDRAAWPARSPLYDSGLDWG